MRVKNRSGSMQERTLYIPLSRLLETPRPGFTMLVKTDFWTPSQPTESKCLE